MSLKKEQQDDILKSRGLYLRHVKKIVDLPNNMAIIQVSGTVFAIDKAEFREALESEGIIVSNKYRDKNDKEESRILNMAINIFFYVFLFIKRLAFRVKKAWNAFWRL